MKYSMFGDHSMKFTDLSEKEIKEELTGILSRCNLDSFLNVETIRKWMTNMGGKNEDAPYLTMVTGLLDEGMLSDIDQMNDLMSALIRLRHVTPSKSLDGRTMVDEFERRNDANEKTVVQCSVTKMPPNEWWDDYHDAMHMMHEGEFIDASEKFDEAFRHLLDSETTWREIYRLYLNAGLSYLYSGRETLGAQCIHIACDLNPNYTFARNHLEEYHAGNYTPMIQLGYLEAMNENIEEWKKRPDYLDMDTVMTWPEHRIIRKLSQFGVKCDGDQFVELAKTVHSPDEIASELFYPQSNATGLDEDFIWIAAYALWNIYCPEEPSTTNLDDLIKEASDFIFDLPPEVIESDRTIERECAGYFHKIETYILSGKRGFLQSWSNSFEYVTEGRIDLKNILITLADHPMFEKSVLKMVQTLREQIPHPDWITVEMIIFIRAGDPMWEKRYSEVRSEHPFYCYVPYDMADIFEQLNDNENAERYFLQALQIVDARVENNILSLDTSRTTIYEDYQYVLDRLTNLYAVIDGNDDKLNTIEKKRKEVEEKSVILSEAPKSKNLDEALGNLIVEASMKAASTSSAVRYYEYLDQFNINFASEEEVKVEEFTTKAGRKKLKDKLKLKKKNKKKEMKLLKSRRKGNTIKKTAKRRRKRKKLTDTTQNSREQR